ncbi:MAG: hypothetical protein NC916_02675 [Candidatus Omnitrophica bacterium]|nr:hypothetical protein [Candidatus Omnitrophota bacterium]
MAFKKTYFCLILFCFLTYPVFGWQLIPEQNPKEKEKAAGLKLVFAALNYKEKSDFSQDVQTLIQRLKITPPFNEFSGVRFFRLELSPEEEKAFFLKKPEFPFLRVSFALVKALKEILGPYKLVMMDKSSGVSAAELSDINHISFIILGRKRYPKRSGLGKGFMHELGHSLGLRDERPSSFCPLIPGPPNCAADLETAKEWWGDLAGEFRQVGFFAVSDGKNTYIIPTQRSLMNDPQETRFFGPVNERYLRQQLGLP